jgi:WD40 repeat protein
VTLWDADTLVEERVLSGHTGGVFGLAFGPGGLLATASLDGTARLWDVDSGEELATLRGHDAPVNQVAVRPDGARIATGSEDHTVKVWDPLTGRQLLTLYGHEYLVYGVAFSPDGRLLASASPDGDRRRAPAAHGRVRRARPRPGHPRPHRRGVPAVPPGGTLLT